VELPDLFAVAREVRGRPVVGVAAYKPANSHPENEARLFDFVGMLGVPLVPCHEFPTRAAAAFFSVHALKDPGLTAKLERLIRTGKPVLVTDGLAARLTNQVDLTAQNVQVLSVKGDPKSLLALPQDALDRLRQPLPAPNMTFLDNGEIRSTCAIAAQTIAPTRRGIVLARGSCRPCTRSPGSGA